MRLLVPPEKEHLIELHVLEKIQKKHVPKTISALDEMQKDIFLCLTKQREAKSKRNNDKFNIKSCNFVVGDFVLVATQKKPKKGTRLQIQLLGPQCIPQFYSE